MGTFNGLSYRFMGSTREGLYFDIVPEPSTALLASLFALGALRRRRSA